MSDDAPHEVIPWAQVLSDRPPGTTFECTDACRMAGDSTILTFPPLSLWCDSTSCGKQMWFDGTGDQLWSPDKRGELHRVSMKYVCRHCKQECKFFAALVYGLGERKIGVVKFGEFPAFGPPLPESLLKLAGSDRHLWTKGRRCENQGLGIAAFSYYRRVIENQKAALFDRILQVARVVDPSPAFANNIVAAKREIQFAKAIEMLGTGFPQSLLVNGHNPLKLIHSSLSDGLHAASDEQCLTVATGIRLVMSRLTELMSSVLSDDEQLRKAVNALTNTKPTQA